jgi:release factor glutamine methyltransferase
VQTHQLFLELKNTLSQYTEEFEIESKLFICHFLKWEPNTFVNHLSDDIPKEISKEIKSSVKKRMEENIPLAYLFKKWPFRKNTYSTSPGVLIPRSDTEYLVEKAIKLIQENNISTIYEIGYGSGIISIELAKEYPDCSIVGWDISKDAYNLANKNLHTLIPAPSTSISKMQPYSRQNNIPIFYQNDFFEIYDSYAFDFSNTLFISNPPYIKTDVIKTLEPQVSLWEPKEALDGGESGIDFYEKFLAWYSTKLANRPPSKGFVLFEIGYDQQREMEKLSEKYKLKLSVNNDLQNLPRVCLFTN